MMSNLFSMFDPSLSLFSFSWVISIVVIVILPSLYWLSGSIFSFFSGLFFIIKKEVDYTISSPMKGFYSFIGSIFLLVSFYNLLAIFPFVFSTTSHMLVTLPLSFSLWLSIIIFIWLTSFSHFLSHLVPSGTPTLLMSFMVLVEALSNLIRPLALTFRLTANMMAGHLLMSLVGGFLISSSLLVFIPGGFVQFLLIFMELGVSIIQAYVFSTLLMLYASEAE